MGTKRTKRANWAGRTAAAVLTGALAMLLVACGGGGGGGDAPDPLTSGVATIGAAGGVVRGEGGAQVAFPAKSLSTDVTVRISKDSTEAPPLPPVAVAAGAVYMITPHGGGLDVHAEVSIPVERTELGPDGKMVLITAQPGDSQWTVLSGATYDKGMMRAPVMHFSYFKVITLVAVSIPTLTFTMANGNDKYNNVGGPKGNLKTTLAGACHFLGCRKYADHYLAAFAYRSVEHKQLATVDARVF